MNTFLEYSNQFLMRYAPRLLGWLLGEQDGEDDRPAEDASSAVPRGFSMSVNSIMLIINAVISAFLGYPFWLLAARLFTASDVGLASGAISAIRLCSQVGLLGVGAAVTLMLPNERKNPSHLFNSALTLAMVNGVIFAGGFVLLSFFAFHDFRFLAVSPIYLVTFLTLNVVASLAMLFDGFFIALRRSDKVAARSIVQAIGALGVALTVGYLLRGFGVFAVLIAWVGAFVASIAFGFRYLRAIVNQYRFSFTASRETFRSLMSLGVPQSVVSLTLTAPAYILPILVTEVLSPTQNAYWYIVWMFGGLVFAVPRTASIALFAESSNSPRRADLNARQSLRLCLLLGLPMAAGMAIFANWGLGLMGANYAHGGTTALRILVTGVIPSAIIYVYVSRERAAKRTKEPTIMAFVGLVLSVAGPAAGGIVAGLPGVALTWVVAQFIIAAWAGWRLRSVFSLRSSMERRGEREEDVRSVRQADAGAEALD